MTRAKRTADAYVFSASSIPDRSTPESRADRRAVKRALGQYVSVLDYAPPGTTDWADAFNAALIDVGLSSDKRLHVPGGNYAVSAALTMEYPVCLFGDGMSKSVIRPSHLGTGIVVNGRYGTGGEIADLTIGFNTGGATSAAHISVTNYQNPSTPSDQYSPDFLKLSGLNLTGYGGSKAQYNIILNGSSRVNDAGGSIPIGLRDMTMRDIVGFNATFRSLDFNHVRVGYYSNVAVYGGSGGVGGAAVYAPSGRLSYNNTFIGCTVNGTFAISDSDATKLYGVATSVSTGANVTNYVNL